MYQMEEGKPHTYFFLGHSTIWVYKGSVHYITQLNFRLFTEPNPSSIGWVDASDHAIGGILATLFYKGDGQIPIPMDNWVLDGAGVLPIVTVQNCKLTTFQQARELSRIMIWIQILLKSFM